MWAVYVTSRVENNMERFREHRKLQKCRKGAGDQPSLNKFFGAAPTTKVPSAPAAPVASPGLGHHNDPHITRYLSRTAMPGGGAPHRSVLKGQILASQHRYQKWLKKELHSRI